MTKFLYTIFLSLSVCKRERVKERPLCVSVCVARGEMDFISMLQVLMSDFYPSKTPSTPTQIPSVLMVILFLMQLV